MVVCEQILKFWFDFSMVVVEVVNIVLHGRPFFFLARQHLSGNALSPRSCVVLLLLLLCLFFLLRLFFCSFSLFFSKRYFCCLTLNSSTLDDVLASPQMAGDRVDQWIAFAATRFVCCVAH